MSRRLTKQERLAQLQAEVEQLKADLRANARQAQQRRREQAARQLEAAGLLDAVLALSPEQTAALRALPDVTTRFAQLADGAKSAVVGGSLPRQPAAPSSNPAAGATPVSASPSATDNTAATVTTLPQGGLFVADNQP